MPAEDEPVQGLDFWKAADFFREKGAERMGEPMLSFGRVGRFKHGGCRWSIMHHLTVGADGDSGSRVNISQESILDRDLMAEDPLAKERRCAQGFARALLRRGYEGEIEEDRFPCPSSEEAASLSRLSGRFDKGITGMDDLAAEYQRFISPNLGAAFGLVPDGELDTMTTIQRVVAHCFGVAWEDLRSAKKHSSLELPRQLAMHLGIELAMKNAVEVAEFFGAAGNMDVVRARKRIRHMLAADAVFADKVKGISRQVEKSLAPSWSDIPLKT